MTRWLRHKQDGTIYEWDKYLDAHPKLEEVSEEIAFPERFLTAAHRERMAKFSEPVPEPEELDAAVEQLIEAANEYSAAAKMPRKGKKRKGLDLHTDDIPEEPEYSNPELNAEASRGLS